MKLKVSKTEADVRFILYVYTQHAVSICCRVHQCANGFSRLWPFLWTFLWVFHQRQFEYIRFQSHTHKHTYTQVKRANQDAMLIRTCYAIAIGSFIWNGRGNSLPWWSNRFCCVFQECWLIRMKPEFTAKQKKLTKKNENETDNKEQPNWALI